MAVSGDSNLVYIDLSPHITVQSVCLRVYVYTLVLGILFEKKLFTEII